ncbi:hypothetical protein VOLCADRAFT_103232 [Volvox carteri f. nagariensis]|uniref:Uncharacterized protein n=1 Tax=Volvox carteri f. nagariensis TaxID=3068 RepID=D8TKC5_VOLCA|nr:uncharacterized protein VOLCADRAFT_103232 [Volvox carteri f. nagariensis]EFJ52225.1 hypothetical protein VOLCADRAFT_103232 [Volvox carteri f. nagariensis]|eukprot:XP_002946999.1 hypothetical protein VOLCADRAFT_103232 [Volvox carteri f. nagariensis]
MNKQQLLGAIETVDAFFRASEANRTAGCAFRLVLMYELFNDTRAASTLYPLNTLRNYARLMADTDLITNVDVDLLPSMSISYALADPGILANYTEGCRSGRAFVWPAFDTHCNGTEYADFIAMDGRPALNEGLQKCVTMFSYKNPVFHNATNYQRWLTSRETYDIEYNLEYEPWYLSWRWDTPWFDFRYRGYGYNKCIQALAMNSTGAKWQVSPHGFVIHRPHERTNLRKLYVLEKTSRLGMKALHDTLFGHVSKLWEEAKADVASSSARLEGVQT